MNYVFTQLDENQINEINRWANSTCYAGPWATRAELVRRLVVDLTINKEALHNSVKGNFKLLAENRRLQVELDMLRGTPRGSETSRNPDHFTGRLDEEVNYAEELEELIAVVRGRLDSLQFAPPEMWAMHMILAVCDEAEKKLPNG